jgi:uncharacterized repeat protein (TIGR01451 family)
LGVRHGFWILTRNLRPVRRVAKLRPDRKGSCYNPIQLMSPASNRGGKRRAPFLRRSSFPAAAILALAIVASATPAAAQVAADVAVQVNATVQTAPPKILLHWPADASASSYQVFRKAPSSSAWGTAIATLPGSAIGYTDAAVSLGVEYEYWVSGGGGSGYLLSGIQIPLVESRGKVVLIVDDTNAAALATELARLESDLAGDGWIVLRHDVARTETVPNVKRIIVTEWARDPANVKAVFLFGHVPVPYAGATAPDGHGNHYGAWPADLFYGDVDGVWTDDANYDSTVAGRQHNVAGDGKYDQTVSPSPIDLEVGRVDLANMPAFAPKTELDLLRQYLNKDHNFRHKAITAQERGLIDDNFGYFGGEAFASSGWRNFSAFFGPANVSALDFFTTLSTQSYLWAYGCGGGNFTGAGGVGSTSNFVTTDTKTVFTMLFGSYFGDWDVTNNFLRAPLATTTYGLTDAWSGRPVWYFHHMGLGHEIGYSAKATQNNSGVYWGAWGPQIHVALMGDPTLRMHVVAPPTNVIATPAGGGVALSWTASADASVGYHVYRATEPGGPFTRVNVAAPVVGTTFADAAVAALASGTYTYAVRALSLETSSSGSYYNASQAGFVDAAAGGAAAAADLRVQLDADTASAVVGSAVTFGVSLHNHGPANGSSVQWSLAIPAGLSAVSVTPSTGCSLAASSVVCNVGPFARGADADWAVVANAVAAGTQTVVATVTGSPADPVAANNTASLATTVLASAPTTTVISSSLNPSTLGQAIILTATVRSTSGGTRTGTVTFKDGSSTLGSVPLDAAGHAAFTTSTLPLGTRSITASYGGSAHFAASTSPAISQSVRANSTTTLASSRNPAPAGAAVIFTAHVASASGSPTGNVSFLDGGTAIGTSPLDATGNAVLVTSTLAAGTHSMTASYYGDSSFNPSNSSALSQVVNAATGAATTTALASSLNPSDLGQTVTFTATVTSASPGTPTGSVVFVNGTAPLGTVTLDATGHATLSTSALAAGSRLIAAIYGGDATFNPSRSANLTQTVRNTTSVVVTSSANPSSPGQSVVLTATITSPPPLIAYPTGSITFKDGTTVLGTSTVGFPAKATYTTSALASGSHSITAVYGGDTKFVGSTSPPMIQVVTGPTRFYTLTPCRLVDTRNAAGPLGGPALGAGTTRTFVLAGHCGIPAGAVAIAANVVGTGSTAAGYFTLYAPGSPRPPTSTLNFGAGRTRANDALVGLGTAGDVAVFAGQASGTVQLILDVTGYFK